MEYKELVGTKELSGYDEKGEARLFILDGATYKVDECIEDDYNSFCTDAYETDEKVSNVFPAQKVIVSFAEISPESDSEEDLLIISNIVTGEKILEIGTVYMDGDAYAVADWQPQNLACNVGK